MINVYRIVHFRMLCLPGIYVAMVKANRTYLYSGEDHLIFFCSSIGGNWSLVTMTTLYERQIHGFSEICVIVGEERFSCFVTRSNLNTSPGTRKSFSLTCSWPTYPVEGYLPLQDPPTADLTKAHKLLGFIKNVLSTSIDTQVRAEAAKRVISTCSRFSIYKRGLGCRRRSCWRRAAPCGSSTGNPPCWSPWLTSSTTLLLSWWEEST